jgi:hypothetical protein
VNGPADESARSTLKPVSLVELSRQASVIWLEEGEEQTRLLGASGAPVVTLVVLALATLE